MKNFNQKSKSFTTFLSLLLRVKRERNVVAKKEKNASVMFELAGCYARRNFKFWQQVSNMAEKTPATPATPYVNSTIVERSKGERIKSLCNNSKQLPPP